MTIPTSVLTWQEVFDRGSAYDFGHWYLSLIARKTTYEHARKQCNDIEDPTLRICSKVLVANKELLELIFMLLANWIRES